MACIKDEGVNWWGTSTTDTTVSARVSSRRATAPSMWTARRSDLCYATTNRQEAVRALAERCDIVLVVGSENSSNTQALVRVAMKMPVRCRFVGRRLSV